MICANGDDAAVVRQQLNRHVELTRAEEGCLHFDVEPTQDPLVWTVSERFVDQAAFDAHQKRVRSSEWGQATADIQRDYMIITVGGR
nr:antibiotic biosynthesis monooxygenase [Rhodococcus sp. HNM0569]